MRTETLALVVCGFLAALGCAASAEALMLTVNSTADVLDAHPGDGRCDTRRSSPPAPATPECTLRAAIQEANALGGSNIVMLPAGTYTLTIPSTAFEDANLNGDLDVTSDLSIVGAGAAATIVEACAPVPPATTCTGLNRVLDVDPAATGRTVSISGLTIRNGFMSSFADTAGGGIRNRGRLTIADSVITGNTATNPGGLSSGGGISNEAGALTLINTSVVSNTSGDIGGGIVNAGGAVLTLISSSVADNASGYLGGGIYSEGRLDISDSSIVGNTSNTGGGGGIVRARGTLTLSNSTISGNTAVVGVTGGIGGGLASSNFDDGPNVLTNCTISGNIGVHGGGIASGGPLELHNCTVVANQVFSVPSSQTSTGGGISGPATLANTIVAGNSSDSGQAPDCDDRIASLGFNLIQSTVGCALTGTLTGNITGQDPGLGVLADNGGPTRTHALLAGSPAIDAGNPAAPGTGGNACPVTDQRGVDRPRGPRCDIGAYEFEGGFSLSGIAPSTAGNAGRVLALIYGSGFATGSTVKLSRAGQPDIVGTPVMVGAGGSVIGTSFDVAGAATGAWDVVVANADGSSRTRAGSFAIEEARSPQLWVDILGRGGIRIGQPSRFTILYGNRGNVDALAVPLGLVVPSSFGRSLLFPIAPPPPQPGQVPTDWSLVPVDVTIDGASDTTIPLVLPVVPAGFTGALTFTLTPPPEAEGQTFELGANLDPPYFQPSLAPEVRDQLADGARAYAARVLGVVVAPSDGPALQQYLTRELAGVVDAGRDAFISGLGTMSQYYGLSQLVIDLAQFAATRTP